MSRRRRGRRRIGRPQHRPTKETRKRVAVAAGGGMTHEEIALALGIARGTLYEHYERELSTVAAEKRFEVANALYRAAMKGRVAAIKEYLAQNPQVAAPPEPKVDAPAKPEKLGKKQQQAKDATTAAQGTEWHDVLPDHSQKPTTH